MPEVGSPSQTILFKVFDSQGAHITWFLGYPKSLQKRYPLTESRTESHGIYDLGPFLFWISKCPRPNETQRDIQSHPDRLSVHGGQTIPTDSLETFSSPEWCFYFHRKCTGERGVRVTPAWHPRWLCLPISRILHLVLHSTRVSKLWTSPATCRVWPSMVSSIGAWSLWIGPNSCRPWPLDCNSTRA